MAQIFNKGRQVCKGLTTASLALEYHVLVLEDHWNRTLLDLGHVIEVVFPQDLLELVIHR